MFVGLVHISAALAVLMMIHKIYQPGVAQARHLQHLDNARRAVSLDQAGQIRLLDSRVKAAGDKLESQDLASQTKTAEGALAKSQKEVTALKKDG
ncbi:hypothetical protein BDY24DRAFT_444484 [Mrakia frigida]|uniref:uncharacterized protein n=1 Tax=Mrakia frigida TaxID=29902 RepID=UPI003FCC028D